MKKNVSDFNYMESKVISLRLPELSPRERESAYVAEEPHLFGKAIKRIVDFAFSLFVVLFGFPFYMLIALMIKLSSPGPVLYVQKRVGLNSKVFKFYKFRTMTDGNNDETHRNFTENFIKGKVIENGCTRNGKPVFKIAEDPRITAVGRFLRRTSLDELPQFINVLKGEMSIVGPRPPLSYEVAHYKEWHKKRLLAKPGITGLWQVSERSTVPFDEMVKLDLKYLEDWSLLLDFKIILRTVPVMLMGSGGF